MSFGEPPVKTETSEEEDELVRHDENESKIGTFFFLFYCKISSPSSALLILLKRFSQGDFPLLTLYLLFTLPVSAEAEVLSAPPKLVYSKLVLR